MKVNCKYCNKTLGEFTVIKGSIKCKRCKLINKLDITTQSEVKKEVTNGRRITAIV